MPVFYKDRNGRYLGGNPAYFSFLGIPAEAYIGKTVEELSPPELAAIYRAADEAVFASPDAVQTYESKVRAAGGEMHDVIFHKAPFRDHQGQVAGLIGIIHDITDLRRATQALRDSEARLMQVLHNSPLPIFVIDEAHRVALWNVACERVIGIPAAEMLGTRDAWRAFYPAQRPVMADLIVSGGDEGVVRGLYGENCRRSLFNPEAFESEGFFPHMGAGSGRWLYFSASPLRNAEGAVVGAIETLVDITERKRAEAEARQLTEELEGRVALRTTELAKANEDLKLAMGQLVQAEKLASLGTLVAGVAHELNTPLGNMRTVASSLHERVTSFSAALAANALRRSMLDDFLRTALDAANIIERNAGRASELISDFKQVAVDQTSTRRRRFDLSQVIHEIYATMRPRLKHSPHRLLLDVPGGIEMDSYPGPLEQVLLNFFNNSMMHGFAEDFAGTIQISARLEQGRVELVYSDNGGGMDEATAAHAFDPFFTTRLGNGGSGLGLYIVFNLVTAVLGGEVRMQSRIGEGTRFYVTLPVIAPTQRLGEDE
jgi:PAS domain S-box-containing protein